MAWSVLAWKILRISQSYGLFGEVRANTRHSSYTNTLQNIAELPRKLKIRTQKTNSF